jgi:cellulose synthase/poly-beta-1,6-N-acetylglucosamine synthase-like glycosyltransferase
MLMMLLDNAVLLVSLALTVHGGLTLYLMLYTWWRPERLSATHSPATYETPGLRFTALIPARHEEEVIAETIGRVWNANYPHDLLEIVVVCERGDLATIAEAQRTVDAFGHANVRVEVFGDGPINKPHGLNVGLRHSSHEIVAIFDAEDDVHPDIFQIVNTLMLREKAPILQAGVQLMDFDSRWYAVHNVLEYFFWFRSRLHFHARIGMVPLGGNTVFMARELIEKAGGWDDQCLTEDADIGIRLSTLGERIAITYDPEHATREETPPTLTSFVKQRTRWNQGFIQVLRKQVWRQFGSSRQRWLAAYTLAQPFIQAIVSLFWPVSVAMICMVKLPVPLAMLTVVPLYGLALQFLVNLAGLLDFARAYDQRLRLKDLAVFAIGFVPYQMILGFGAVRAVYRELRGATNWEKTEHIGAHRARLATTGPRQSQPAYRVDFGTRADRSLALAGVQEDTVDAA